MSPPPTPALRVPYKTVHDVEIPTDVYIPISSPPLSKPYPVLIMIHGGAFMLGHAGMNNKDQINDCLERGWVVLAIEHRLCPGVNVLEGPMADVRDALRWAQDGGLETAIQEKGTPNVKIDGKRVMMMGTSSGGHLALSTAWSHPHPPLAILDFYGAKHFADASWTQPLTSMPPHFSHPRPANEITALHAEVATFIGGLSLEGHSQPTSPPGPDPKARQAFAMHAISTGTVVSTIWPAAPAELAKIDPFLNVSRDWPPTAIVHGSADTMIPMRLSRAFYESMVEEGVETEFIEVEGEPHTFCGTMVKGSRTWETQRRGFEFLEGVLRRSY